MKSAKPHAVIIKLYAETKISVSSLCQTKNLKLKKKEVHICLIKR